MLETNCSQRKEKRMSKQIKVGVVGCGYWGPNLVRNFRSLPDCSLKVMCDISKDRLMASRKILAYLQDHPIPGAFAAAAR